jgi:hypothetical protein
VSPVADDVNGTNAHTHDSEEQKRLGCSAFVFFVCVFWTACVVMVCAWETLALLYAVYVRRIRHCEKLYS